MRKRRFGQDVVGEAMRELRKRVRRARRDEQKVGAGQVEIEILGGRAPRERAERLGGDEALGPWRDERDDLVAGLHEQAAHLACLVGGNAAGNPEQDPGHARKCA